MSIRYIAAVLDSLSSLNATDTLLLVALADYADDDTRQCFPSVKTLARRARCDRRTVQRRLRSLEERGYLETAPGGHQYGANTSSRYRLKFDHAGELVHDVEPKLSPRAAECRPSAPKQSTRAATNTHKGGTRPAPRAAKLAAPSLIDPSLIPRAFDKRGTKKTGDKSRLEQLEELRKLQP